jgi:putative phage-type endonuclease
MQGNKEWKETRRGKITASRIADLMATGRGGKPSATRENYLIEKALERITGNPTPDSFQSNAMMIGSEREPIARGEYEAYMGEDVEEIDFVDHPTLPSSGCSPDGLISTDGLVEIKCPQPKKHFVTLRTKEIDRQYLLQIQWQLECTGRLWCDFVSYNPDFPEQIRLCVIRVNRDDQLIKEIRQAVVEAEKEIADMVTEMTKIMAERMKGAA